jgi:hypothetical protein
MAQIKVEIQIQYIKYGCRSWFTSYAACSSVEVRLFSDPEANYIWEEQKRGLKVPNAQKGQIESK